MWCVMHLKFIDFLNLHLDHIFHTFSLLYFIFKNHNKQNEPQNRIKAEVILMF